MSPQAEAVLDFWFIPAPGEAADAVRAVWFGKDEAFDAAIRTRFGALIAQALDGGLHDWDAHGPRATLARILVLDQFCRNVHRGTPLAFAGDALAVAAAQALVDGGFDQSLPPLERAFVYLPFEHAEDLALQEQAVALFARLRQQHGDHASPALRKGLDSLLDYARRHHEVIAHYGRFPHRNAILGRASTPAEQDYLRRPGAGF